MIMPVRYYSILVLFGYCSMLMVFTDATETVSLKQIFFFVSRDMSLCVLFMRFTCFKQLCWQVICIAFFPIAGILIEYSTT